MFVSPRLIDARNTADSSKALYARTSGDSTLTIRVARPARCRLERGWSHGTANGNGAGQDEFLRAFAPEVRMTFSTKTAGPACLVLPDDNAQSVGTRYLISKLRSDRVNSSAGKE